MSTAARPGPRAAWWLMMHAAAVVFVLGCECLAMSATLALPVPLFIGLRLAQGAEALLGGPWSLSYLVPLLVPAEGRAGAMVMLGTPMMVNLALHLVLVSWLGARQATQTPGEGPGAR